MKRLSGGEVVQVVEHGRTQTFRREFWRLEGEAPLSLVRKTSVEGPTRPPVVLVHGFAQNRYSWHTQVRSIENWLADHGWDVWNLELRGTGLSREPGTRAAECFEDYVDDVVAVAEHFKGEAFFVGHSMGGGAIYCAATRSPMRGVVGIAAMYGFGKGNPLLHAVCRASIALEPVMLDAGIDVRTRFAGQVLSRLYGLTDVLGYWFPLSGWWPGSVERELLDERLVAGFDWTSTRVWREMSRWSVDGFPYARQWKENETPLLVVLGDEDSLMPPADGRGAFDVSGSPDKTLRVFDFEHDEVHWGHLDLVLGRHATNHVWPVVDSWMAQRT